MRIRRESGSPCLKRPLWGDVSKVTAGPFREWERHSTGRVFRVGAISVFAFLFLGAILAGLPSGARPTLAAGRIPITTTQLKQAIDKARAGPNRVEIRGRIIEDSDTDSALTYLNEYLRKGRQGIKLINCEVGGDLMFVEPPSRKREEEPKPGNGTIKILKRRNTRRVQLIDQEITIENCAIRGGLIAWVPAEGSQDEVMTRFLKSFQMRESYIKGAVYLTMVEFRKPASFKRTMIDGQVVFARARFFDLASFKGVVLKRETHFEDTLFELAVNFDEAQFEHDAYFDRAMFVNNASFENAQFRRSFFRDAGFLGKANFTSAKRKSVESPGAIVFDRAKFAKAAEFRNRVFGEASFQAVDFQDDAGFSGVRFDGEASFHGARFHNGAVFHEAIFQATAAFNSAVWEQKAVFWAAKFRGPPDFKHAAFRAEAFFSDAEFAREVVFGPDPTQERSDSGPKTVEIPVRTFHDQAFFSNCTFRRDAVFADIMFPRGAEFTTAKFLSKADFTMVKFGEKKGESDLGSETEGRFRQAEFRGGAYFKAAVFRGKADFEKASFVGGVDFSAADFLKETVFKKARFASGPMRATAPARFDLCTFHDIADFTEARFQEAALFSCSLINRELRFENARFENDLDFAGITVEPNARISFVGARCEDIMFGHQVLPDFPRGAVETKALQEARQRMEKGRSVPHRLISDSGKASGEPSYPAIDLTGAFYSRLLFIRWEELEPAINRSLTGGTDHGRAQGWQGGRRTKPISNKGAKEAGRSEGQDNKAAQTGKGETEQTRVEMELARRKAEIAMLRLLAKNYAAVGSKEDKLESYKFYREKLYAHQGQWVDWFIAHSTGFGARMLWMLPWMLGFVAIPWFIYLWRYPVSIEADPGHVDGEVSLLAWAKTQDLALSGWKESVYMVLNTLGFSINAFVPAVELFGFKGWHASYKEIIPGWWVSFSFIASIQRVAGWLIIPIGIAAFSGLFKP